MSTDPVRTARLQIPTELALVGVSLAAVYSFTRLFSHDRRLWALVLVVLVAHALLAGCRALGWGLGRAAVVSVVAFGLTLPWIYARETLWYVLPTADTLARFGERLGDAWLRFQDVKAPTAPTIGFLLASAFALWVMVFLADWAAFRLNAPFEAVVPAGGLFLFTAVLGTEDGQVTTTAVLLVAVVTFLLLHRVARQERSARWLATETGRGSRALLRAGGVLGAVAVVGGLLTGYNLPTAQDPGLVELDEGGGGGGARVTLSPLVDIKARLIDQQSVEVFTVRSTVPSYWRLTALDSFDGEVWGSGGSFQQVDGPLANGASPARTSQQVQQEFDIEALSAIWLPAAFEATSVDPQGFDVRWEPSSATLIVDSDRPTSDDTTYRVVSELPMVTAGQLRTADRPPNDIAEHYTLLPDDFSPYAHQLAQEVTAGQFSPYAQALALQNFFRENFTYSLTAPAGHGENAIESFLDPDGSRQGYCEQFAGTYAAMARSIGLPARVAVGFTQGQPDPGDPNLYRVRGEHAHAWPEVYLAGFGWMPFEPTPGRGLPGAESYTGVAPEQVTSTDDPSVTTPTTGATASSVTAPPQRDPDRNAADQVSSGGGGSSTGWWTKVATLAAVLLVGALLYVVAVFVVAWIRPRARRRRAGHDPTARTRASWADTEDALADLDIVADPAETHLEFAQRTVTRLEVAHEAHLALAEATTAAEYREGGVTTEVADQADRDAEAVVREARQRRSRGRRWRRLLDPRERVQSSRRKRSRIR